MPAHPHHAHRPEVPAEVRERGELTSSSENPAGTDAVPVGVALLVGDAEPVDAEALGVGEVGAVEDCVGVGVGRPSSEQPVRASARKDSTASAPTVVVRDPSMTTSSAFDGTCVRPAAPEARPGASAHPPPARPASGILGAMNIGLRDRVLPENERRTLEELSDDLDLRSGDTRAKQSAFWTMLVLSGIIATAGVLADSTATVIGAMIIAPLSTPIMGIALGIVKRERIRAGRFVLSRGDRRGAHRRRRGLRGARHRPARPTLRSPAAPRRPWST